MRFKSWNVSKLITIGFAILTIVLAIVGYYVQNLMPYVVIFVCILNLLNIYTLYTNRRDNSD